MKTTDLESVLKPFGLHLRGLFSLTDNDIELLVEPIARLSAKNNLSIALVGNIGSSYWPQFTETPEYADGLSHPLDRWSKRVASKTSSQLDVSPLFPSDGPPYFPFQQWAKRAEGLSPSPLGLLIHPDYGLWHSYRFALILSLDEILAESVADTDSPCINCAEQPCLNTCPVQAFSASGFDILKCAEYLNNNSNSDCNQQGCQARISCPVGETYRYADTQHLFHLQAFIDAR